MRAMILAAGLGTRMRPLSDYRAKPALPVCGRPVISLLLELLAKNGIREILINLHHQPDSIREAVAQDCPDHVSLTWSEEPKPLGTGGGIRRAAEFLRESPDCLVMAGDMLLDLDLAELVSRHHASARDVTLVLRDDPRGETFGTIGTDANQRVTRVGKTLLKIPNEAPEAGNAGLFTSVRLFSREALCDWPSSVGRDQAFEDLRDWLAPRAEAGELTLGAEVVPASESVWEPAGTLDEYLRVNLSPPALPSLGGDALNWCGDLLEDDRPGGNVIARSATLPPDVDLTRCVVWDSERLPAGFRGRDGVYGGDKFHSCLGSAENETNPVTQASGSAL